MLASSFYTFCRQGADTQIRASLQNQAHQVYHSVCLQSKTKAVLRDLTDTPVKPGLWSLTSSVGPNKACIELFHIHVVEKHFSESEIQ